MLNNDLFSDVKFVVRKSDGESESKQVIPAHKFMLSIGIPVFKAMFYGELAETRDFIELPDCEYESLFELFRYAYSDEVNLSGSNVMGVLYLAKKYMVPSLAEKCTEYLQDNLDPSNVFNILPSALIYEEKNLVDLCWKMIDEQTEVAVKSDGFATIERSLLEAVIERDTLNIAEVELFKGVVGWATKQLEKRGTEADPDGEEKRRILGERIVKAIRFPVMKLEDFASVVLDSKILTLDEVTDIIKCFCSMQSSHVQFLVSKRRGPDRVSVTNLVKETLPVAFEIGKRKRARLPIRERTKFMLNNDLFSDVKFVVRKSDGESESKQVIPAHKFVLSIGSPVFEAMFYGELAETGDSIELPDCEYESLLELFRYMYSDEVNLSGSNVMGVMYLAKNYMVPSLAEKCTEYLQVKLDPSNVFNILSGAQKCKNNNLVERCWEVIDEHTELALKSDGFATIERCLLEELVERDTLNIAEVELFKGVVEWAKKVSEKQGLATGHGQEIRRILGERIIKAIRFPLMNEEEFSSLVLKSRILILGEVSFKANIYSVQSRPVGFPESERSGPSKIKRCCRSSLVNFGYTGQMETCRSFSVDRDILFHGVYLFGSKDKKYSVCLTLRRLTGNVTVAYTGGIFSSEPHTTGEYYGFDVLFKEPTLLRKGVVYSLEAISLGPKSWYGAQGDRPVQCSGVTFKFYDTYHGVLNEFIFSLSK